MRARRLSIGLVVPALLVCLVGVLATLQYRWLGKVSEAEREQLRRSLQLRAQEFADDFDGEISRVYRSFQLSQEDLAAGDWDRFSHAVDRWRGAARYPKLVREIYLAEASTGRHSLRRYDPDARSFDPAEESWPPHLEPVRAQLSRGAAFTAQLRAGEPGMIAIAVAPILSDVPAVLIPVLPAAAMGSAPALLARAHPGWQANSIVVELDYGFLRSTVLPELVARHFPEGGGDPYRVAVLSGTNAQVFARGLAPGASMDSSGADVVAPFFSLRLEAVRDREAGAADVTWRSGPGAAAELSGQRAMERQRVAVVVEHRSDELGAVPAVSGQVRVMRAGWRIVLRHASGSLDVAVSQARRRNLWLSFGILGVLAAGIGLIVMNARRSGQLAKRQMDFVATVSHELRTPLAVIRSAAQNLSAGVVSDAGQARRYGELIEDEGRRLTEMVEQILEYSRVEGDRPLQAMRPVDMAALAHEIEASCRQLCDQAGVTIEVSEAGDTVPPVLGDEEALRRALSNLVTNALKHGADGRWIGVSVRSERAGGREEVLVSVTDRGRGIDAADIGHVFEPFYRGRHAVEHQVHGNGLGLSLVRRVAEAHGGTVTVRSAPGEGSTFTIQLPAAAGTHES